MTVTPCAARIQPSHDAVMTAAASVLPASGALACMVSMALSREAQVTRLTEIPHIAVNQDR